MRMGKLIKEEKITLKNNTIPNPNTVYPIPGYDKEIYVKPTI